MERIYRKLTDVRHKPLRTQHSTRAINSNYYLYFTLYLDSQSHYIPVTISDWTKPFVPHPWRKKRARMDGWRYDNKSNNYSYVSMSNASLSKYKTPSVHSQRKYATHHNMPIQSKITKGMGQKVKTESSPRAKFINQ